MRIQDYLLDKYSSYALMPSEIDDESSVQAKYKEYLRTLLLSSVGCVVESYAWSGSVTAERLYRAFDIDLLDDNIHRMQQIPPPVLEFV